MTQDLFTPEDSAVLLIDHQRGTMSWVQSIPLEQMRANALALARAAKALDMPLVLTSSLENQLQGPLTEELAEIAPAEYEGRIQRSGVVNALDDPDFAAAVQATGRRNLIIAGVTNDVCTVYPTLTALQQGYRVQVVAGATLTSTNMILTELAVSWASPAGQALQPIVGALIPT